jgi:hypothetical protein
MDKLDISILMLQRGRCIHFKLYILERGYEGYGEEVTQGMNDGLICSMTRTGVGSAVQLSSYDGTKNYLLSTGYFHLGSTGAGYLSHLST